MRIVKLSEQYTDQCCQLAKQEYIKEGKQVPGLLGADYNRIIYERLTPVCKKKQGVIAIEKNEVIGFLAYEGDWMEQEVHSYFIPLYCYGVSGQNRLKTMSYLLEHLLRDLVTKEHNKLYCKVYAHDQDMLSLLILSEFTMMTTEGCRSTLDDIQGCRIGICHVADQDEIEKKKDQILNLYHNLINRLQKSPVFYPGKEFTDDVYMEYIMSPNTKLILAEKNDEVIGMINTSYDCEYFPFQENNNGSVSDIIVLEKYRNKGVAQALLNYSSSILKAKGVKTIYVEHGTANPNARGFWDKYFNQFCFSLCRQIN